MRWVRLGVACTLAMGLLGCPETASESAPDAFVGGNIRDQGALLDALPAHLLSRLDPLEPTAVLHLAERLGVDGLREAARHLDGRARARTAPARRHHTLPRRTALRRRDRGRAHSRVHRRAP